jgi:hypothetical protein
VRTLQAIAAGLRAPWTRLRLVLALWGVRLVPVLLAFGLPVHERALDASARHPDSGLLLDAPADASGFAYAWTSDFFRDGFPDAPERVFWIVVVAWVLGTVLAGGIVAKLVDGDARRPLLQECGRYAGPFLRLGLVALAVFYVLDAGFNAFLREAHEEQALHHHTQDFSVSKQWVRGLPFLVMVYLLGLVHAYARIDVVASGRRSALLCFARGLGILVARLPWLLLLETGMLLAAGAAVLIAGLVPSLLPLSASSSWVPVGLFLALLALTSLLRTGVEVGAMDARCRLLVDAGPSRNGTEGSWLVETPAA